MLFTIEASSPVPIYAQIVGQVRAALAGGELEAGDPLPSVRQLASELRVNPNTVAQAYAELERDGVVYVQRGRGTFASADGRPRAEERRALAREVARRALLDAHRHGLDAEELLDAVREAAGQQAEAEAGAAG